MTRPVNSRSPQQGLRARSRRREAPFFRRPPLRVDRIRLGAVANGSVDDAARRPVDTTSVLASGPPRDIRARSGGALSRCRIDLLSPLACGGHLIEDRCQAAMRERRLSVKVPTLLHDPNFSVSEVFQSSARPHDRRREGELHPNRLGGACANRVPRHLAGRRHCARQPGAAGSSVKLDAHSDRDAERGARLDRILVGPGIGVEAKRPVRVERMRRQKFRRCVAAVEQVRAGEPTGRSTNRGLGACRTVEAAEYEALGACAGTSRPEMAWAPLIAF